jgi:cell division protein ZapA
MAEEDIFSIQLKINGKDYPLRIKREREEEYREAARQVTDIVRKYRQQYTQVDQFDALNMAALQFVLQSRKLQAQIAKNEGERTALLDELRVLDEELTDYLTLN